MDVVITQCVYAYQISYPKFSVSPKMTCSLGSSLIGSSWSIDLSLDRYLILKNCHHCETGVKIILKWFLQINCIGSYLLLKLLKGNNENLGIHLKYMKLNAKTRNKRLQKIPVLLVMGMSPLKRCKSRQTKKKTLQLILNIIIIHGY